MCPHYQTTKELTEALVQGLEFRPSHNEALAKLGEKEYWYSNYKQVESYSKEKSLTVSHDVALGERSFQKAWAAIDGQEDAGQLALGSCSGSSGSVGGGSQPVPAWKNAC